MKLYLSSHKLGNREKFLKRWIQHHDNNIVLITSARDLKKQDDIEKEKINENVTMLESLGFNVKLLSLKDYFDNQDRLKEDLKDYHAFCVIGGNVFVLRQAMKLSGFDDYLKEISQEEDYLYIGYSAGSCVLSPTLYGLEILDEPINPYNDDEIIYEGLHLINYVFLPHCNSSSYKDKVNKIIEKYQQEHINYDTFNDEEVIIENTLYNDREYLEKMLPGYLERDIKSLRDASKKQKLVDCLINEVQGSNNSAWVDGFITEKQCDYIYEKYIRNGDLYD